ncbi:TPA: MBL fold metallo-hydrolase [bacterium UBP9_UBA11836]|nr:MBL fold metallo-hydrolase [bacterium UBP9_UBA11836]
MFIRYLGHSSFYIRSSKGTAVVLDPYSSNIPYQFPSIDADIVVMSHEHRDHNASYRVGGNPMLVKPTSPYLMENELNVVRTQERLTFYGVPTYHDNFNGRRRGPNTVWHFYWEGIHFVHLGDLGHILTDTQVGQISKADVLFIPVGGNTTLGPAEAGLVINQLQPNIVLPMHYKTDKIANLSMCSNTLDDFVVRMDRVEDMASMSMDISQESLPVETTVALLRYE